jgi:DNA integrity scanning protein DisA with diadenylate cyclase activity
MEESTKNNLLIEEEVVQEKIESLKEQVARLYEALPCTRQCSQLSNILQKLYELREGINQLEQGLLQSHLKCCISPNIRIPSEVVLAVSKLSAKRHGAIIVVEQKTRLDDCVQGGVAIEAVVSPLILENIFFPGSPLHDGAVLIRDTLVQRANCVLPLSPATRELEKLDLGTRHRAAIGLSQMSDALVIVVSEEKGWISLALRGQLYPNLGTFGFLEKIGNKISRE